MDKYATISCADTAIQAKRITLHAQVVPNIDTAFQVELSSSILDFTVAEGGKPKEKTLYLKNTGEEKFKVSLVDYPDEYFKIKLGKDLKPGNSLKVRVKPDKELPDEEIKTSFTFELEGKEKTKITIPLIYQGALATSQKK